MANNPNNNFVNNRMNSKSVNTNRATINSKRKNTNCVKTTVYSNSNLSPNNNKSLNQMSSSIPQQNMVSNNIRPKNECKCDPEFIDFCKIHTISHSDCGTTRQVFCQLCSTSADFKSIQWHLQSDKHQKSHQQLMEYVLLLSLPECSQSQANKITELLNQNYRSVSLNKNDSERRVRFVQQLNQLIKTNGLDGYSLRIYGSTIDGFALKESDINLDIVCDNPEKENRSDKSVEPVAIVLSKISEIIERNSKYFDNIRNEFNLKVPKLRFKDRNNNFEVEISITSEKSYRLSKLLHQYCQIDERVKILGIAFREWARIYGFDDQENGLWPSVTFPLLVIHYLQRCSPPILPCLHELANNSESNNETANSSANTSANTSANSSANNVKEPQNQSHSKIMSEENDNVEDFFNISSLNWQKLNNKSVGQLWLDILRYYSIQMDTETFAVSIRTTKPIQTRADKHWGTRMLAVEDPARPSLNLSRSVGSMRLYNNFIEQLRQTYKYFSIPMLNVMPNSGTQRRPLFTEKDFMVVVNQNFRYINLEVNDLMTQINHIRIDSESESKNQNNNNRGSDESDSEEENNRKKENFFLKANRLLKTFGIWMQLLPEIEGTLKLIPSIQLYYTFAFNRLPFFQRPPKFCRLCHRYGHQQIRCPEQQLPLFRQIPDHLDAFYDSNLNKICHQIYQEKRMDQFDLQIQNEILSDLQQFIRREYSNARLNLFGSTKNGFGARNCDLDICLTFEDNLTGEGLEFDKIIEKLGQLLKSHNKVKNIVPIVTAKVPIIKFGYFFERSNFVECDISLYNILAIHNTEMLSAYTQIDQRVPILGFVVKHFAKTCDMCDASRGSLSSYAYTLMTIHYLQQKRIIPVLQEIGLEHKQERIVDGWDTWYFDDLKSLEQHWTPSQNQESVAQLFVGFLRYYSEIFNFDEYVICCRQFSLLKRLEKMWTGSKIAIEDPFLLSHNLGAGVSAQMAVFIRTALVKGRNLFGAPPNHSLDMVRFRSWSDYFFSRHNLTNGHPPTGRGCRICGKIGHKQNMCPEKRDKRENREKLDEKQRPDRDRPERQERTERPDRPDRQERVDRTDKNIKQNRPEKQDRNERPDRQEKYDRKDRPPKNERQDKPDRTDRTEKFRDKKQNNRRNNRRN